jgi:hypothetical protein
VIISCNQYFTSDMNLIWIQCPVVSVKYLRLLLLLFLAANVRLNSNCCNRPAFLETFLRKNFILIHWNKLLIGCCASYLIKKSEWIRVLTVLNNFSFYHALHGAAYSVSVDWRI